MKFDSSRTDISSSPSRESESNKIDDRGPPKTKSDNTEFLRTFSADEDDSVGNESKAVKWVGKERASSSGIAHDTYKHKLGNVTIRN